MASDCMDRPASQSAVPRGIAHRVAVVADVHLAPGARTCRPDGEEAPLGRRLVRTPRPDDDLPLGARQLSEVVEDRLGRPQDDPPPGLAGGEPGRGFEGSPGVVEPDLDCGPACRTSLTRKSRASASWTSSRAGTSRLRGPQPEGRGRPSARGSGGAGPRRRRRAGRSSRCGSRRTPSGPRRRGRRRGRRKPRTTVPSGRSRERRAARLPTPRTPARPGRRRGRGGPRGCSPGPRSTRGSRCRRAS